MHFTLTAHGFRLTRQENLSIEKQVAKLIRFMPIEQPDYPLLDIIMRKQTKKGHAHFKETILKEKSAYPLKGYEAADSPIYYDGTLNLSLPKKRIATKMLGKTPSEALHDGFDELFRQLDIYKGLHFPNDSTYDTHR